MKETPLISIIIVNYNGRKYLEECIASLMKVTYPRLEIILVDNNSSDDSVEFVKNAHPSIIIIKLDKNYGFAYPNNVGAKNAKGEMLLFLNNDTTVDHKFVDVLVNTMNNDSKVAICQSMLLKPNGDVDSSGDFIDTIGVAYSSKEKVTKTREILSARGAAMMIRKDIFKKLGGFDEKFYLSFEDVDLGWRTWILGYRVVVVPDSIVYHLGGKTTEKMKSELAFHGYKNQLSMKFTNFERSNSIKSIILFFWIYGIRMIRLTLDYKIKGSTTITSTNYEKKIAGKPNFKEILKSLLWIIQNQHYLLTKSKMVNSHRKFSTKELKKLNLITDRK